MYETRTYIESVEIEVVSGAGNAIGEPLVPYATAVIGEVGFAGNHISGDVPEPPAPEMNRLTGKGEAPMTQVSIMSVANCVLPGMFVWSE